MNFKEYQQATLRTWKSKDDGFNDLHFNAALGIGGEAGEVLELIKKDQFHAKPLDPLALAKELGDVLYYVSVLAHEYGLNLQDIAEGNIQKLKERWPNGIPANYGGSST